MFPYAFAKVMMLLGYKVQNSHYMSMLYVGWSIGLLLAYYQGDIKKLRIKSKKGNLQHEKEVLLNTFIVMGYFVYLIVNAAEFWQLEEINKNLSFLEGLIYECKTVIKEAILTFIIATSAKYVKR
jgi:hypothetical protein